MSRQKVAYRAGSEPALGPFLRQLRESRNLALWEVAAAAQMDSTLLSKIELGHRFPSQEQAAMLAKFFELPLEAVEGRRIVARFWRDNADNPAVADAIEIIHETAPAYAVNKSVSKRRKATG